MSSKNNNSLLPMNIERSNRYGRNDRLIGINKVLEKYDVSETTLRNRIKAGKFPEPEKDGGRSLWWESEVDEALRKIGGRSNKKKKEGE